jgi:Fe-S-cluster containining protein
MVNKFSCANKLCKAFADFDAFTANLGITNICIKGCNSCCKDYFYICENEFLYILQFLHARHMNLSKYIGSSRLYANFFRRKHPDVFDDLETYKQTEREICRENDLTDYNDLPLCIFWEEGLGCAIYSARPSVCRWYGTCAPCKIIGNIKVGMMAVQKLADNILPIYSSKNNQYILSRSYPIFYWFYKFLSPNYKELTRIKVKLFSYASEEKLAEFKLAHIKPI